MQKAKTFKLIVRSGDQDEAVLSSEDADVLRNCGAALASTTALGSELMLVHPNGHDIAEYDIWSSQWCAAA